MAQNKAVNTLEGGLVRVNNKTKQPKGTYSHAENAVIPDTVLDSSSRQSEKSFDVYIQLPVNFEYTILGNQWLGTEEYVLFIKETSGTTNQIWYINKGVARLVISNPDLNWREDKIISSTYRIDYKNHRIIYFVDGFNDDRVIDIDDLVQPTDMSLISLQTSYNRATVDTFVSDTGGSLQSGQYFIALSYGLNTDFNSSIFGISRPVSIAQEDYMSVPASIGTIPQSINQKFGNVSGSILGRPTKKSLRLTINNIDTTFDYINIIIVQYEANNYKVKVIKNIAISGRSNINYTYTGFEGELDPTIDLSDIIIDNVKYYASEVITQKENRLIRGNSKLRESSINYQAIANNIKIKYQISEELIFSDDMINYPTKDLDPASYDPLKEVHKKQSTSSGYMNTIGSEVFISKSFMRDEVYSLGIGFELSDGSETDVFHIPGRAINDITGYGVGEGGRLPTPTWDEFTISGLTWRDFNTAVKDAGDLAYWRSSEVYPDGYGYPTNGEKNSAGKSYVRHHRMPSDNLEPLYRTTIVGNPNTANTASKYEIYRRNINLVASNIIIPEEYRELITKVKIYYTPRTDANKRIRAKGLLYPLRDQTETTKRQPLHFSYADNANSDFKYYEFISPDTSFRFKDLPLSASKIRVLGVDKAYVNYVGQRMRGVQSTPLNYKVTFFNNDAKDTLDRNQRITTGVGFYNQRTNWKGDLVGIRNIDKLIYVDGNFVGNTEGLNLDFKGSQNTTVLALANGLKFFSSGEGPSNYPELQFPTGATTRESLLQDIAYQTNQLTNQDMGFPPYVVDNVYYDTAYYVELINTSESLYGSVQDLSYVSTGSFSSYIAANMQITVKNGDTFIDTFNFKSTSIDLVRPDWTNPTINPESDQTNINTNEIMVQSLGSFITETDLNIRMRTYGDKDAIADDERFFPKRFYSLSTLREYGRSANVKEYYNIQDEYNIQYIQRYFINQRTQESFEENVGDVRYANRLVYSPKQDLESKIDSYRSTRANDYRDLPSDKGPITGIFTKQQNLFALTRDSLFNVYASNQTIQTESEENITVGTGEFFGIEPTEVISIKGGFGGTSSKASISESPYGYLFVDRHKSKVILFTDRLQDINDLGLDENFTISLFKQFPSLVDTFDTIKVGISSIYDPLYKRIIITKRDYELIDFSGTITTSEGYVYRNGIRLDYNDPSQFINKSFTVSYDCIHNNWISYHTYLPINYIQHPTNFLMYDGDIKKSEGNGYLPFTMEVVVNENPLVEKVLDSVTTNSISEIDWDRTRRFFDEVMLYTTKQCSGIIPLYSNNVLNPGLLTNKEDDWNFKQFLDISAENNLPLFSKSWNDIKNYYPTDKVINPAAIDNFKPWNRKGRLRDKYFVIRFMAKNLDLTKIIINFVTSSYRISVR